MDPRSVFARKEEVQIIDVREPFEWQAGHIEGARHIPMRDIPVRLGDIDDDKTVLAVCRSGNRSAHVTKFLRERGFDIHNLAGGMKAWAKADLPVLDPEGRPGKVV